MCQHVTKECLSVFERLTAPGEEVREFCLSWSLGSLRCLLCLKGWLALVKLHFSSALLPMRNLQMGSRPPETYWSLARSEVSLAKHISTHLTCRRLTTSRADFTGALPSAKCTFDILPKTVVFQSTGLTPRDPWTQLKLSHNKH